LLMYVVLPEGNTTLPVPPGYKLMLLLPPVAIVSPDAP